MFCARDDENGGFALGIGGASFIYFSRALTSEDNQMTILRVIDCDALRYDTWSGTMPACGCDVTILECSNVPIT
jgi:hypothetical protein